ncbi:MAG: biotin/lipoate A/B protein ligase family protein [Candidatus Kapaibacterium sp.]
MAETWLYGIEENQSGEENMKRDRMMAEACAADGIPRLRFYSWSPWTLSLGYNQKDERIDREALTAHGYELVRRPTGGRAVFHAEEITYGVAMLAGDRGVHETYAMISKGLNDGFGLLGATDIEFSRSSPDFREHYRDLDSDGCFSASALNELTWQGRKVVGSAQRRYGSVLLQHGSILLGPAHLDIVEFLGIPEERRQRMRTSLQEKTATLSDILSSPLPSFQEIAEALLKGFAQVFDIGSIQREDHYLITPTVSSMEIAA